ncbi:hypothetical protein F3J43_18500 [Pantoea sp. Cy-639]|nr:hypothetical protein [Pantoea sp. Cy-639]
MIEQLEFKVRIFLLASPFCLGLVGLALDLHIACSRDFKKMTSALQRSECLSLATYMWGERSIKSRVLVVSMISSELMFPNSRIRRGSLDVQDHMQFPKPLKRKIITAAWLNVAGFTWLITNSFIT